MTAIVAGLPLAAITPAQAAVPGALLGWGSDKPFQGLLPAPAGAPGQLCDNGAGDTSTPVPAAVPANAGVTAIAAGAHHSLAVIGGAVFGCGLNRFGQLGDNTLVNKAVPVAAVAPANANVVAVSAGWDHSLALTTGGTVLAWGNNTWGQLGDGTFVNKAAPVGVVFPALTPPMTAIAAGAYFSLALDSTGQVWSWGFNGNGELGQGAAFPLGPVAVAAPGKVLAPANANVTAIAAGADHSLALTTGGAVLAWGLNNYGQLGNPAAPVQTAAPVAVNAPANGGIMSIAAGGMHSLALTTTGGAVLAWGRNNVGQVGNNTAPVGAAVPVPVNAPANANVVAIAAGWQHSLAVTNAGAVLAWGWNSNGQLGAPAGCLPVCPNSAVPVLVGAPANAGVSLIAGGYSHSIAVK